MMLKRKHRMDNSVGGLIFDIFNYTFMVLFCISILFPFWDMLVKSVSHPEDISYLHLNLFPKRIVWDAYEYCLHDKLLLVALRNSVARTIAGSLYHLIICCLTAFGLTRTTTPFLRPITIFFLITMFFSGGLIPTYLNIQNLGLLDNFLVYVLPGGFSMYNAIIIRNYFFSIDRAMEESATIDGASMIQILLLIILPLSKPVLATVGLWTMVGQWNSWFDNMIYARSDSLLTLQYMLKKISSSAATLKENTTRFAIQAERNMVFTEESVIAATTVITVTPIICVYPFLQKYFVKGIMLGAVKG
jgi:putative aldouronate transport system permease protein